MKTFIYLSVLFSLVFSMSSSAAIIEIAESHQGNKMGAVKIEGEIVKGDAKRFTALVLSTKGANTVFIASPGGDVLESMLIGNVVRAMKMDVWAPMTSQVGLVKLKDIKNNTCASSAFFIYVAGVKRTGRYLGIHRPYLSKEDYNKITLSDAAGSHQQVRQIVEAYCKDMGVPLLYVDRMMAMKSDEIEWLDEAEIKKYFSGFIPEMDEWFMAHSPRLSSDEIKDFDGMAAKLRNGESLTAQESKRMDAYRARMEKQVKVEAELLEQEQEKQRALLLKKFLGESK